LPIYDVNENEAVYYDGTYWNDLTVVNQMFNLRISGRTRGPWFHDFSVRRAKTFKRGLILNCGNGWVEREMVSANVMAEAVGVDYSDALLVEARRATASHDLPLRYHQMNVNSADFPAEEFDLVVCHAAAHHVAMIDRVFRAICRILPEDGWFVSLDYVGPHRNQYTTETWERAWRLNNQLPPRIRQSMTYPHLPTMLRDDPTEAIHSELIVETLHRYFDVERFVPLGGAIAYPILTHNAGFFAMADKDEQTKWAEEVLRADQEFLSERPDSTLFAYFAAKPNKAALDQSGLLWQCEQEEIDRENKANANGGEYYPRTAFQDTYIRLVAEADESNRLRGELADLQDQLDEIRRDPAYSRLAALRQSWLFQKVRYNRVVRSLESRLRRTEWRQ
jgi:SAM-dependent methyltransferase